MTNINLEVLEDTRSNIRWLARTNPTVHNCLTRYYQGEISYEQALTLMVAALAEQNEQLIKELQEDVKTSAQHIWVLRENFKPK